MGRGGEKDGRGEGESEELCVAHYTITHHLNDSSYCTVHTYFQAHAIDACCTWRLQLCLFTTLCIQHIALHLPMLIRSVHTWPQYNVLV